MSYRMNRINWHLKGYDSKLFCRDMGSGLLGLYRKPVKEIDAPHFIFPLTKDWTMRTEAAEWGIEPLMLKLRESDGWSRADIIEKLEAEYSKAEASKSRDLKNKAESFFSDNHSEFKKAFGDINTSNMDMKKGV